MGAAGEFWGAQVIEKVVQGCAGFLTSDASNTLGEDRVDVERFPPGLRMCAHDGVFGGGDLLFDLLHLATTRIVFLVGLLELRTASVMDCGHSLEIAFHRR